MWQGNSTFVESNNKELSLYFDCLLLILLFPVNSMVVYFTKISTHNSLSIKREKGYFMRIRVLRTAGCLTVPGQANLDGISALPHRAMGTSYVSLICRAHMMLSISQDPWENPENTGFPAREPLVSPTVQWTSEYLRHKVVVRIRAQHLFDVWQKPIVGSYYWEFIAHSRYLKNISFCFFPHLYTGSWKCCA